MLRYIGYLYCNANLVGRGRKGCVEIPSAEPSFLVLKKLRYPEYTPEENQRRGPLELAAGNKRIKKLNSN